MRTLTVTLALSLLALPRAFAEGHEAKGEDAQAINAACASDSATAGCGDEKVGTGLLKCLHKYKKEHKDHHFSEGCKAAMMAGHMHRKEKKKAAHE